MANLQIPVTKAKTTVTINTDEIPEEMYFEALRRGLKDMINSGMSKITTKGLEGGEAESAKAAALEKAEANLAAIKAGKFKIGRQKAEGKASGAVMTEARRIARGVVKDMLRQNGYKISLVAASDITAIANKIIAEDPSYIKQAEANLEARKAVPLPASIDLGAMVKVDPKKAAAAEAKKAEAKTMLSAKQAGITAKVAGKAKPSQATAH